MNTEGYHVLINGERKGPYSLSHLLHLFSAGFISRDTLYWREGFEEWQQVGLLCDAFKRKQVRLRWLKPLAWLVILAAVGAVAYTCIPVFGVAWREAYQSEYTAEAAYWRARQSVREHFRSQDTILLFAPFSPGAVELKDDRAVVRLSTAPRFEPAGAWKVDLVFSRSQRIWNAHNIEALSK